MTPAGFDLQSQNGFYKLGFWVDFDATLEYLQLEKYFGECPFEILASGLGTYSIYIKNLSEAFPNEKLVIDNFSKFPRIYTSKTASGVNDQCIQFPSEFVLKVHQLIIGDGWVLPRRVVDKDAYYMGNCWYIAQKSKDPKSHYGSVIISSKGEILGTGFNGPPRQFNDYSFSWSREDGTINKYPKVRHAEQCAIDRAYHRKSELENSVLYVNGHPCIYCSNSIIEAGIKKVIYWHSPNVENKMMNNKLEIESAKENFRLAKVELIPYFQKLSHIESWVEDLRAKGVI